MKKNVQQTFAKSIGQTPDADSEIPDTRVPADVEYDWIRLEWQQSKVRSDDRWNLETVDRALHAAGGLQGMLMRDQRGRALRDSDPEGTRYDGFKHDEMEAVHTALGMLLHTAVCELERVRVRGAR